MEEDPQSTPPSTMSDPDELIAPSKADVKNLSAGVEGLAHAAHESKKEYRRSKRENRITNILIMLAVLGMVGLGYLNRTSLSLIQGAVNPNSSQSRNTRLAAQQATLPLVGAIIYCERNPQDQSCINVLRAGSQLMHLTPPTTTPKR